MAEMAFEFLIDEAAESVVIIFCFGGNRTVGEPLSFEYLETLSRSEAYIKRAQQNAAQNHLRGGYDMCMMAAIDELVEQGLIGGKK